MLARIRQLIKDNPDRKSFFGIIGKCFPQSSPDYVLIELAYDVAQKAFEDKFREGTGERYFEHLRGVALILIVHMRVVDAETIVAAILHDIIEDIEDWTQERIALKFTTTVGILVWWVTKPSLCEYGGDKDARDRVYHQNLHRAPRRSLMIKLADRLHNLLTMWGLKEEKRSRKVRETQDFYLPLAEKETLLIHELEDCLDEIMSGEEPESV